MEKRLFTSECVTKGHPDKVADAISDGILDACLAQDPGSRVACETMVTTDRVIICGEITTKANVNYEQVARDVIRSIGYTMNDEGFCADTAAVECHIHTPEKMPLSAARSRALVNRHTACIAENPGLRPDGKTQVSVAYDENGKITGIDTVVVSVMHREDYTVEQVRSYVHDNVIAPVLAQYGFKVEDVEHIYINPTGKFVIGGPNGDTGLTGRKIIVDTYGGYFPHGGGAFSGKDPTKVDRSAAYMARYLAKNLVDAGLADKVQIQLAYAIGVAEPVSVRVDSFGTGKISDEAMTDLLRKTCDLTPGGIIRKLDLRRPIYSATARDGHFGVAGYPWEQDDLAQDLKKLAGL